MLHPVADALISKVLLIRPDANETNEKTLDANPNAVKGSMMVLLVEDLRGGSSMSKRNREASGNRMEEQGTWR